MNENTLTDAAVKYLEQARERGILTGQQADSIGANIVRLGAAIADHRDRVTQVRGDTRLSEVGQNERLSEAHEAATERVTGITNRILEAIDAVVERARRRAVPTPPSTDAPALEARLANARMDARMVLDAMTDEAKLGNQMAELVDDGDDAMRWLLLGTHWPEMYFQSRGAGAAAAMWRNRRVALMPYIVDEDGQAAMKIVSGESVLNKAKTIVKHIYDAWMKESDRPAKTPGSA